MSTVEEGQPLQGYGSMPSSLALQKSSYSTRLQEVFTSFLPLGYVTFGGPNAHIAILHDRFVVSKQWLTDSQFLELMAVGQGLPGPTSTQMVIATGTYHAGFLGGLLAFLLFSMPSFVVCTLCGMGISAFLEGGTPDWMSGLAPAAVALVCVAAFKLAAKVNDSKLKIFLSMTSACITVFINGDANVNSNIIAWVFPLMLIIGGLIVYIHSKMAPEKYPTPEEVARSDDSAYESIGTPMWVGGVIIGVFAAILGYVLYTAPADGNAGMFATIFRIGSTIYGGGQVVLPMLLDEVVNPGWLTRDQFLQGFAIVQALPGPLFNIGTYVGAVYSGSVSGALAGYVALFLPGFLLILGFIPFWAAVRKIHFIRIFLKGVNSAAIGLVAAACVLLWRHAVHDFSHAIVFLVTGCMQGMLGQSAPVSIVAGGLVGWLLSPSMGNLAQESYCA